MWEFLVGKPDRLDRSLRGQDFKGAEWLSRQAWEWLIEEGRITVNGRKALKPGANLSPGDAVRVDLPGPLGLHAAGDPAPLVWASPDRHWAIFDKPVGLDTVAHMPWDQGSFASRIAAYAQREGLPFASLAVPPSLEGGLLQRLDRDTSGLVCAAFEPGAKERFRALFSAGEVEKTYLALVTAQLPAGDYTLWFPESHGAKVRAGRDRPLRGEAEEVVLSLEVCKTSREGALLSVRTRQGRRHVVRAALAALGAPLLGDQTYGGSLAEPFHQLHASALRLPEGPGHIEVPPPQSFLDSGARLGLD